MAKKVGGKEVTGSRHGHGRFQKPQMNVNWRIPREGQGDDLEKSKEASQVHSSGPGAGLKKTRRDHTGSARTCMGTKLVAARKIGGEKTWAKCKKAPYGSPLQKKLKEKKEVGNARVELRMSSLAARVYSGES